MGQGLKWPRTGDAPKPWPSQGCWGQRRGGLVPGSVLACKPQRLPVLTRNLEGELWVRVLRKGRGRWLQFVNKSCVRMCLPACVQPCPSRNCIRTLPPAGHSCGTPGPGPELRKTQTSWCFCIYFKVHTAPPTHPSTGFGDATPTPYGSGQNVRSVAPGLQEGPPLGTQQGELSPRSLLPQGRWRLQ